MIYLLKLQKKYLEDPIKVTNSVRSGFRGGAISIGEKSINTVNEVRGYQTLLWQQNPKLLLSEFNLRSLIFEQPNEATVIDFGNLKSGQYTFQNPFLKGKDDFSQ